MNFDDQHPSAEVKTIVLFQGDEYMKISKADFCWNCGLVTSWYSTSFLAPICSEKCATEKWNEYWEALHD